MTLPGTSYKVAAIATGAYDVPPRRVPPACPPNSRLDPEEFGRLLAPMIGECGARPRTVEQWLEDIGV
jgi:hypothetical protein